MGLLEALQRRRDRIGAVGPPPGLDEGAGLRRAGRGGVGAGGQRHPGQQDAGGYRRM